MGNIRFLHDRLQETTQQEEMAKNAQTRKGSGGHADHQEKGRKRR